MLNPTCPGRPHPLTLPTVQRCLWPRIAPRPSVLPSDKHLSHESIPAVHVTLPSQSALASLTHAPLPRVVSPGAALSGVAGLGTRSLPLGAATMTTSVSPDVHVHGQSVAGLRVGKRVALALQRHVALGAPHRSWVDGSHFSLLQWGHTTLILRATAGPTEGILGHHGLHQSWGRKGLNYVILSESQAPISGSTKGPKETTVTPATTMWTRHPTGLAMLGSRAFLATDPRRHPTQSELWKDLFLACESNLSFWFKQPCVGGHMKPGNGTGDSNLESSRTSAGGGARQSATRPCVSRRLKVSAGTRKTRLPGVTSWRLPASRFAKGFWL